MKTPLQKLIFHYKQETMSAEKLQKIAQEVEQEQGYGGTASGLYADIWMEAYRRLEANQPKEGMIEVSLDEYQQFVDWRGKEIERLEIKCGFKEKPQQPSVEDWESLDKYTRDLLKVAWWVIEKPSEVNISNLKFAAKEFEKNTLNQDKVLDVPKRWTDEAMLAEWMHDTYEEIAAGEGWETQKDCKVLFDDLPEKNKAVMLKVAGKLLDEGFNDPDLLNQDNDWKRVGELANEITKIVRNETN